MPLHEHLPNGAFTARYCRWRTSRQKWRFSPWLFHRLEALAAAAGVSSVADLGAGIGRWVRAWQDRGYDAIGYDAIPGIERLSGGVVRECDLGEPQTLPAADLVVTLDVGEHIPIDNERAFIDNCCAAAGGLIIVSWGSPGQPGCGHVNCLSAHAVRQKFSNRGMRFLQNETKALIQGLGRKASKHYGGDRMSVFSKQAER